ncbi:thiolase family protein [Aneurinibacillus terranovensis]|uniref:thiolase family protein n=1 Tax=Aneurinibacillus terranovensis TaxID=278991 RepID=UPI0004248F2B|nr:acetyl-CoA C-acetyltransferase [Aneurinibacillus terranovensis]
MEQVVIVAAGRSPIGEFGGSLKSVSARELATHVVKEVVKKSGLSPEHINELILGNCIQRTDEPNIARTVAIDAGFGNHVTGFTVQRQCSSGMQAIVNGVQEILLGDSEIVVAGGVENMSNAPYVLKTARWGNRLQHGQMTDTVWEILMDPHHQIMMGETAERLADKYEITREEQDEIAYLSHQKAIGAIESGRFAEEIVPIPIKKKKETVFIDRDEHVRTDITLESLANLSPIFRKNGTVTAGNASGINDGAAAVVLMTERKAKELNLEIIGKIKTYAWVGVEADLMGYGPVPATHKALKRAGYTLDDIQLIEVNEAFAAQYLTVEKLLGLNREIVNVNGSGISLGHPIGCTGARIVISLLFEMKRRDLQRGLATLCIGGGMGMSMIVERE